MCSGYGQGTDNVHFFFFLSLSLVFGKSGIDRYSMYNDVQRFDVKIGLKLREI